VFTVKIPKVGTVSADTLPALGEAAWTAVHGGADGSGQSYGVSQVGSGWPVTDGARKIGTMRYNGRFDAVAA